MKKEWILGALVIAGGTLHAAQTLSLTFDREKTMELEGREYRIPAGRDGFLEVGKTGLSLPAQSLLGEQGTVLFQFKLLAPSGEKMNPRYVLTLRCKSRMSAGLYIIEGPKHFRFSFGDRTGQIYHVMKEEFKYGQLYHAGIAWDGSRVRFYLDGKLVGDDKQPVRMEKISMLNLGPYRDGWMAPKPWGNDVFIKSVRTFNTMLTSQEVAKESGVVLKSAGEAAPPLLTVPLNPEKAPVINGELTETFWRYGASLPVLTNLGKPLESFQAPQGKFLLSYDARNLYVGFSYHIPAGNPVNAGSLRTKDSEPEVWGTESFELYLFVNGNLYRFAGNAAGGYTEWKNNGVEWNGKWDYRSQVKMLIDNSSVWQGEAAIPWKTLELNGVPEKPVAFNFCRTWCLPDYSGATSLIGGKGYSRKEDFVTLAFGRNIPAVQVMEQNNPGKGAFRQKVSIASPAGQEAAYEVALLNQDGSSEPFTVIEKKIKLNGGIPREIELDAKITTSAYDAIRYTLKQGNRVVARNMVPFKLNEVYLDARPRFLSGKVEFDIQTGLLAAKFGADCSPALVLKNASGREIYRNKVTADAMTVPFSRKNPPGNYTAEIIGRDGSVLSSLSIHFPGIGKWAEMEFDKTVILPPFTPLKVNGTDYSMWGRTYSYENSLFPCRIQSQGVELLSAPCEIVANGRAVGNGKTEQVSAKAYRAEFKGSAGNQDCSVTADSWVEYDGVAYSKFTVQAEKDLKNLKLRFTLPAELVKYLHTSEGGSWGAKLTKPVKDGRTVFRFYPMVWVGMEDKGICFFTETRSGWTVPARETYSIMKKDGKAVLEVAMRKELKAGEKFEFEFGFIATPVKPLPGNYPLNIFGDSHCPLMRRPGRTPVNSLFVGSAPYPNEISSYFCDLPNEKESPAVAPVTQLLKRRDAAGNKMVVYMDARYLSDEYPEMAAFKDEWKFSPERTLNYTRDGRKYMLYDCCPVTGASAFFHMHQKRFLERFKADGIYYDFGTFGICSNPLHGCRERYPILAMREFYRRTALVQYQSGIREPLIVLHNTDSVQIPAITFATHLFNGEHIRQSSSTIMHNGKDIQDTYSIEMFASELGSMPFGLTNAVYQSNDVLLPQFGGGKEEPELYKFRITQAFLAGTLPHNTIVAQSRCHYGILDKIVRIYDAFRVPEAGFIGYWNSPATVKGAENIYVSVYKHPSEKKALAVISHIGKAHENQKFEVVFNSGLLGFTPQKAVDKMTAPDPEYGELYRIQAKNRVPRDRAPLKLGDFGSKVDGIRDGSLKMSLKYHTFALVELSE